MQLDFTAEQDELRAAVRAVLVKECPITLVRGIVETGDFAPADELWHTLARLDWLGLTIDESDGGLGLGFVELAVVVEELGRVIAPGPLLPTLTQFLPAVRETGGGDRLAAIAAGQRSGTLVRGDLRAAPATTGSGGFAIDGRSGPVVEAGAVDEYVVAATLPGGATLLAALAATDVTIEAATPFDRSRRIGTLTFHSARVTPDRVLTDNGAAALARAEHEAIVAQALEMVGACQTIFDTTVAYAKHRHQFGVPIGSFQAVKHKAANLFVALERARATAYFAAACIAEDDPRRALAASMAKAAAGDCQRVVTADGIQLLGGIGYTWEHDQHLYVKRAKLGELLFGTAADHRAAVADHLGI